jgi:hypothetical protein
MNTLRGLAKDLLEKESIYNSGFNFTIKSLEKIPGGYKCKLTDGKFIYPHCDTRSSKLEAVYAALDHMTEMGHFSEYMSDSAIAKLEKLDKKKKTKKPTTKPVVKSEEPEEEIDEPEETLIEEDVDDTQPTIEDPYEREDKLIFSIISR